MKCKNCGREIDNPWGFCPHCGFFTEEFEDSFNNIARMLGGKAVIKQEGDSFVVILEVQGTRHAFRVTPIDLEEEIPPPSPSPPLELEKVREHDKTEEPETETIYAQDRIYIKVNLSGVMQEDIEVDELEDSLEVRAYKGKTQYFKLIPIPDDHHVVSIESLPGEVIITLEKE